MRRQRREARRRAGITVRQDAVGADAEIPVTDPANLRRPKRSGAIRFADDDVVVADRVTTEEPHRVLDASVRVVAYITLGRRGAGWIGPEGTLHSYRPGSRQRPEIARQRVRAENRPAGRCSFRMHNPHANHGLGRWARRLGRIQSLPLCPYPQCIK